MEKSTVEIMHSGDKAQWRKVLRKKSISCGEKPNGHNAQWRKALWYYPQWRKVQWRKEQWR